MEYLSCRDMFNKLTTKKYEEIIHFGMPDDDSHRYHSNKQLANR